MLLLPLLGCDDGSTTIIQQTGGGGFTITTQFPSRNINANTMADDQSAFNNSFAKFGSGYINVFWNCANGTALVLYIDNFSHLWASYFNGTDFGPPVELNASGQDFNINNDDNNNDDGDDNRLPFFRNFRVLWLNTAAQGRNGDALILWVAEQGLDGNEVEGPQVLFGTYFDVSRATVARTSDPNSGAEINYGFYPGTQVSDDTEVTNFGFISDSLKYSHCFFLRNDTNESESIDDLDVQYLAERSGDPTSFVYLFWRRNGSHVTLEFDLNQVGGGALSANRLPSGAGTAIPAPPVAVTNPVRAKVVVHNGKFIWQDENDALFLTCFGSGPTTTILLNSSPPAPAGTPPPPPPPAAEIPLAADVYGGDHGLTSLYAFFREFPNGTSLMCAKVDLDSPTLSREIQDIDGGGTDVEHFAFPGERMEPRWHGTRINREEEYIFVMWTQNNAVVPCVLAQVNVVQTRRTAAARTLAQSVAGAEIVPNQDMALDVREDFPRSDDNFPRISIQSELANGSSCPGTGVQSNRFRVNFTIRQNTGNDNGGQRRDNLIYNGVNVVLGSLAGGPTSPSFTFAVPGASPAGQIEADRQYDEQELVLDRGTAEGDPIIYFLRTTGTTILAGGPSGPDIHVRLHAWTPGASAAQLVSTSPPGGLSGGTEGTNEDMFADVNRVRANTTPVALNQANNYAGDNIHVFFTEPPHIGGEGSPDSNQRIEAEGKSLRTRYFDKSVFAASSLTGSGAVDTALANAHVPALGGNPVTLDHGATQENTTLPPPVPDPAPRLESTDTSTGLGENDNLGPLPRFFTSSGNIVGIYFRTRQDELNEGGHIYYQEFRNGTWMTTTQGDPDPQPVDVINFPTGLFGGQGNGFFLFPPPVDGPGNGNTMSDTMVFYMKPQVNDVAVGKWRRLYVSVHD